MTGAGAVNRIDSIFAGIRREGRKALMPFVCAGHPTPDATPAILRALDDAGAAVIEIGFPFSDPIADGPVIAAAMHEALLGGITPGRVLDAVADVRASIRAGLVAMVSVSIVHRLGPDRFAADLARAGFDGVILPDVPVDEAGPMTEPFRAAGLTTTLLVSPTTPRARVETIVRACTGFVYLLARVGITGSAGDAGSPRVDPDLGARVASLRSATDLPIACGFGIATAADVAAVVGPGGADAAIVGSALVRELGRARERGDDPSAVAGAWCRALANGLAVTGV